MRKANPFAALLALTKIRGIGSLVWVVVLTAFPQFLLQSTWVLFTTFRFGWGPRENGFSLFIVGIAAALGQTVLLGFLLRKLGDVKTALAGLASSVVAYVLYGLATQGWMMYAIILANLCGFAAGPALQGIVSKAVDPRHQGITLGSLNSISSIMGVIAPLVGAPILAAVSGLNPTDWRVGATFFVAAIAQMLALGQAFLHFRKSCPTRTPTSVRHVPANSEMERWKPASRIQMSVVSTGSSLNRSVVEAKKTAFVPTLDFDAKLLI